MKYRLASLASLAFTALTDGWVQTSDVATVTDDQAADSAPVEDTVAPMTLTPDTIEPEEPAPEPTTTTTPDDALASSTIAASTTTTYTMAAATSTTTTIAEVEQSEPDWANLAYSLECGRVSAVQTVQHANGVGSIASSIGGFGDLAVLVSVTPDNSGSSFVFIDCQASDGDVYRSALALAADHGTILDWLIRDTAAAPTSELADGVLEVSYTLRDGTTQTVGYQNSDGTLALTARPQETSSPPDLVPPCSTFGFQECPRFDGGPNVTQGPLIASTQRRLIELGFGAPILESGGADGSLGFGTSAAFEQWFTSMGYTQEAPFVVWCEDGLFLQVSKEYLDRRAVECT